MNGFVMGGGSAAFTTLWVAALGLALLALPGGSRARGDDTIDYTVRLDRSGVQLVEIEVSVPNVAGPTIDFALPVWRPGRYEVLDTAGTVREVRAADGAGRPLAVEKVHKSVWRVAADAADRVVFTYTVYANSINNRTRHADDTHAFLSGASVFAFVPDRRSAPVRVTVEAPEGWRVATGLEPDPASPADRFVAETYDVLVDSPLEIGLHHLVRFEAEGVPHEIVLWGRGAWKDDRLIEDFSKIIRAQAALFGRLPYRRYVFMVHSGPGLSGGTEHLNSTIMQTGPSAFDGGDDAWRGFLGLVSHEFFHTWNVKQFRPAGLSPYDYLRENYTELLWVAEGTTSYYDDLMLVRAGLDTPDRYLKMLADAHGALLATAGRRVQSLESSSFDAWIKFNRPTPDSGNTTVSFYSKGALVSLLLDLEIRRRGGGSLDDVMRRLFDRYPCGGRGYTSADLRAIVAELTGEAPDEFWSRYVAGTDDLPLAEAFGVVGLELKAKERGASDAKSDLGLRLADRGGLAAVESVVADGPAWAAGVQAGDEIVALDVVRLRAGDLPGRLKSIEPGTRVRLTLLRRDVLRDVTLIAGDPPAPGWSLSRVGDPSGDQRAEYESWLGRPWPSAEPKTPQP